MPRQRAPEFEDLPKYLYAINKRTAFGYRRPDNGKTLSLGSDKGYAIRAANAFNDLFGVEEVEVMHRRPSRAEWDRRARTNAMLSKFPDEFKPMLPEIFPAEAVQARTRAWAHQDTGKRFTNGRRIRTRFADPENLPNWVHDLYRRTRRNAERREIEFKLTESHVAELLRESGGLCTVTGIQLTNDDSPTRGKHVRRPWAPSIDRIDSEKGYTLENCRIVCGAANLAMNMWGEEVLLTMAKAMARKHLRGGSTS